MKRLALVLALVATGMVAPVPFAAGQPALVDVIAVLKSQANVASVQAPTRAAQLAGVERALRDQAARTQYGILQLLAQRRGSVAAVTPLWITNAIEVKATPDVIREVAARPEVATIQPNALTVAGLPSGATATWSSNPIATPGSTTLRVLTTGATPRSTFTPRITGTSGALTHQVTVSLVIR